LARKPTDTVQLKLRFSEALRRRLEREAARQDRSLNSEIISRVEQSFQKRDESELTASTLRAAFGGATGDLLRAIGTAIWLIERRTGKKWNEDFETYFSVKVATDNVIEALAHSLTPVRAAGIFKQREERLFSADLLERIAGMMVGDLEQRRIPKSRSQIIAEIEKMETASLQRSRLAKGAALEALQKMGMAPSDAEIAEAGKKDAEARKREADNEGSQE
jgi:hypothetical protein